MKTLDWHLIRRIGKTDKANRWYPCEAVADYFGSIRSPSRSYPNSYARAAQTQKFAKWLVEHRPEVAKRVGLV